MTRPRPITQAPSTCHQGREITPGKRCLCLPPPPRHQPARGDTPQAPTPTPTPKGYGMMRKWAAQGLEKQTKLGREIILGKIFVETIAPSRGGGGGKCQQSARSHLEKPPRRTRSTHNCSFAPPPRALIKKVRFVWFRVLFSCFLLRPLAFLLLSLAFLAFLLLFSCVLVLSFAFSCCSLAFLVLSCAFSCVCLVVAQELKGSVRPPGGLTNRL